MKQLSHLRLMPIIVDSSMTSFTRCNLLPHKISNTCNSDFSYSYVEDWAGFSDDHY